ncbi:MAG: hypothetical protein LW821_08295 [Flammeovirgaceae bacterium]|nr:hypothetical protein [Flammeovirgaceae bacterium]
MKYNSINEYFLKMQRRHSLPVFLPAIAFMVIYYLKLMDYDLPVQENFNSFLVVIGLVVFSFFDALLVMILFKVMVRRLLKKVSLGVRMDGYAQWSIIRFFVIYSGSWLFVLSFLFSGFEWLSVAFLLHFLFYFVTWPSRERLCKDLKLTQAEREVIYSK